LQDKYQPRQNPLARVGGGTGRKRGASLIGTAVLKKSPSEEGYLLVDERELDTRGGWGKNIGTGRNQLGILGEENRVSQRCQQYGLFYLGHRGGGGTDKESKTRSMDCSKSGSKATQGGKKKHRTRKHVLARKVIC